MPLQPLAAPLLLLPPLQGGRAVRLLLLAAAWAARKLLLQLTTILDNGRPLLGRMQPGNLGERAAMATCCCCMPAAAAGSGLQSARHGRAALLICAFLQCACNQRVCVARSCGVREHSAIGRIWTVVHVAGKLLFRFGGAIGVHVRELAAHKGRKVQ
jgi:hypothetical protein